jgi:hypothetical protein
MDDKRTDRIDAFTPEARAEYAIEIDEAPFPALRLIIAGRLAGHAVPPFGDVEATEARRALTLLTETTRELEAYKRAKTENDERFMIERDEAREERDILLVAINAARSGDDLVSGSGEPAEAVPLRLRTQRDELAERYALLSANSRAIAHAADRMREHEKAQDALLRTYSVRAQTAEEERQRLDAEWRVSHARHVEKIAQLMKVVDVVCMMEDGVREWKDVLAALREAQR